MGVHEHRSEAPMRVKVALLTISDTRTEASDTAGQAAKALIADAGHALSAYRIVKDDEDAVCAAIAAFCDEGVDAIVTAGGTGVSARDRSYEAIHALLDKELTGFGELFRMLSYTEIGAAAMLSRATAGLHRGVAIFACPGSEAAVRLALAKLVLPELGHVVREARR